MEAENKETDKILTSLSMYRSQYNDIQCTSF